MKREDREFYQRISKYGGGGLGRGCGPTLICFICVLVLMLSSCKAIRSVESHTEQKTEQKKDSTDHSTVQKDSALTNHTTNTSEKEKTHTESHTEKKDSFVNVVDQNGNIIGTKEYHWLRETLREVSEREKKLEDSLFMYKSRFDSIGFYKDKIDSLSNIVQGEKIVEVEKSRSIKERISTFFSDVVIGLIIFIVIYLGLRLIRK